MNRSRQLASLLLSLLVLASLLSSAPAAAADERCFTETGFCISGRFRAFWEQQGGLAVFGFPVTAPRTEVNRESGQPYLTQWFERVRFELHPEQAQPYDVLLGRIGDDRLQGTGVSWQNLPKASGPQAGCLWFAETGHNVCDQGPDLGFKHYWQTHGLLDPLLDDRGRSLALFGLPLSEATTEINPTDGQPYLAQWFERGRFEWHPEQADPQYRVLLGLLGKEVLLAPQKIGDHAAGLLVASGTVVVWEEHEEGQPDKLYAYDIDTHTRTAVASSPWIQTDFATDGRAIVWVDAPPGAAPRMQWYDLAQHQQRTLLTAQDADEEYSHLAIADGVVYFEHSSASQRPLFALDLNSGAEQLISPAGHDPLAADGFLLWTESSTSGTGPAMRTMNRLFLRSLDGHQADRQIAQLDSQSGFSRYAIANGKVVWAGYLSPISVYDIHSGATTTFGRESFRPMILGQYILWGSADVKGQWSINRQVLTMDQAPLTITEPGLNWNFVGVGGNSIVYGQYSDQGVEGIYIRQLS